MLRGERWRWRYPANTSKANDLKSTLVFLARVYNSRMYCANQPHGNMITSWHANSIACDQHQSYSLLGSSSRTAGTMRRIWKSTLAVLSASSRSCRSFSPPNFSPMIFLHLSQVQLPGFQPLAMVHLNHCLP
jgi:hypothetical protein